MASSGLTASTRSERLSIFAEDSYDLFGVRRTLAQTYGVNYTPDAAWTVGGNVEVGTITDNAVDPLTGKKNSDFDRKALSLTVGYKGENDNSGRMKGEVRRCAFQGGRSRGRIPALAAACAGFLIEQPVEKKWNESSTNR